MESLIGLLIIIAIIATVYLSLKTTTTFESKFSRSEVLDKASHILTMEGYAVQDRSENSVSLVREKKPNCIVGGALFCIFVFPAIIYAVIGGSKIPIIITVRGDDGKTQVTATGIRALILKLKMKLS